MTEPDFELTGVRVGRRWRSVTRAGQVLVQDGRLTLLTSYGREIASASVDQVRLSGPVPLSRDLTFASLDGKRYSLRLDAPAHERLDHALGDAREQAAKVREAAGRQSQSVTTRERSTRLASDRRTVST